MKPHDVAQIGQQLRVKVYEVSETHGFYASLKQLTERVVPELGSVHRGIVQSVVSFGVFVELSSGATGLVRDGHGLAVGDELDVEVTSLEKFEFRRPSKAPSPPRGEGLG